MKNFSPRLSQIYDTSAEYKMEENDLQHILKNALSSPLSFPATRECNLGFPRDSGES